MVLINLIVATCLIFLSGLHWCAYRVDKIEEKPQAVNSMWWSIVCGILGLYHIIALVGLSARSYC